jgi:hypothetical protein
MFLLLARFLYMNSFAGDWQRGNNTLDLLNFTG